MARGAAGRWMGHVELNQELWSLEKFLAHTEANRVDRWVFRKIQYVYKLHCTICVYCVYRVIYWPRLEEWPYFGHVSFNLQKVGYALILTYQRLISLLPPSPVADLRGVREVQMQILYFCVRNCTSPSNDYTAVAYSNNQAQLHSHVSVPYWSPDVCLGLELLRDIQLGL